MRWALAQWCEATQTARGMAHDAVRPSPGWQHHMVTTIVAPVFLGHLTMRLGKTSPRADGIPATDLAGRGVAAANVYPCRSLGARGKGTAASSPVVSVPPHTAPRGWRKAGLRSLPNLASTLILSKPQDRMAELTEFYRIAVWARNFRASRSVSIGKNLSSYGGASTGGAHHVRE